MPGAPPAPPPSLAHPRAGSDSRDGLPAPDFRRTAPLWSVEVRRAAGANPLHVGVRVAKAPRTPPSPPLAAGLPVTGGEAALAKAALKASSSGRRGGATSCSLITIGRPSRGLIFFARLAYLSELSVSSNWSEAGLTLAIIVVRQLPPSEPA